MRMFCVEFRTNFMPTGNARSCEVLQSSQILHLVEFVGRLFVRVCHGQISTFPPRRSW
jgi:hypothetical protein